MLGQVSLCACRVILHGRADMLTMLAQRNELLACLLLLRVAEGQRRFARRGPSSNVEVRLSPL